MTTERAVLGLDLGTSQVKALVCGGDGSVLGRGVAGYPVRARQPGWAESEPEEWWRATGAAVRAALAGEHGPGPAAPGRAVAGLASAVQGIAVVGQMHGSVLVDGHGGALRPAVLWPDRRTSGEVAEYRRLPAGVRSVLGNPPVTGMAGPTLRWLSRHEPQSYRRTRWLLQPKDWLRLRLTGEIATDPTDASGTLLYDLARRDWAAGLIAALGLRGDLLPPLRQPAEIAGTLRDEAARFLGLPPGLPVAIGAADTAASLLAAGLPGPDWCLLTLGTGGQWAVPVAGPGAGPPAVGPGGRTNTFCAVDGGLYRLAAAQNVGIALQWVTGILGAGWDDLYATAGLGWEASTPVFLPFLVGERGDGPAGRPGAAWAALSLAHRREDLLRAALEGVAFLLRGRLEDLRATGCRPAQALLAGGGSRDPSWRRLLGEVLQLPLSPAATPWLTARGAALIAGVATGMYRDWAQAARSLPRPQPAAAPPPSPPAEAHYLRFRQVSGSPAAG